MLPNLPDGRVGDPFQRGVSGRTDGIIAGAARGACSGFSCHPKTEVCVPYGGLVAGFPRGGGRFGRVVALAAVAVSEDGDRGRECCD